MKTKEHNVKPTSMKRMCALLMAIMMLFSLSVVANSSTIYDKTVKFTNVKNGDSVLAYRLVSYDTTYNNYVFNDKFDSFVSTKNKTSNSNTKYLVSLGNSKIGALLSEYAIAAQTVDSEYAPLPDAFTSGTAGAEGTVSLTLEPGYYMILGQTTSSNSQIYSPTCVFVKPEGSKVKVYAGADGAEITSGLQVAMKTESAPTLDKQSKNPNHDGETWSSVITSNTGDVVEFRVKVDIPSFSDGTKLNLTLNDTMYNMEYVADSIKVYSNAECTTTVADAILEDGLTVSAYDSDSHTQNLKVALNFDAIHPEVLTSSTIYVYYQAVLHQDASVSNADAYNTAKLEYSNKSTPDSTIVTEDKKTEVDLFEFKLHKTDEYDETLAGAAFSFYKTAEGTTPITFSQNSDGTYYPDSKGAITSVPCDENGDLHIVGLDVGTYYVAETTTPVGYYAPSGRFILSLARSEEKNVLATASAFKAVNSADTALINADKTGISSDSKGTFIATLKNSTTPILPEAGGAGTIMFTIAGLIMMALACAMVFAYRKKQSVK